MDNAGVNVSVYERDTAGAELPDPQAGIRSIRSFVTQGVTCELRSITAFAATVSWIGRRRKQRLQNGLATQPISRSAKNGKAISPEAC